PGGSNYTTFRLNMAAEPGYQGLIRRLRFDPTDRAGVSVDIDYIRVIMPLVESNPAYEFDTDTAGWTAVNASVPAVAGGYLTTTGTSNDPRLISPDLTLNSKTDQFAYVAMRAFAGTAGSIIFQNPLVAPGFIGANEKVFAIPTNADRALYNINLNSLANFQPGTITKLRFDPSNAAGDIMVDKINVLSRKQAYGASWEFNIPGYADGWSVPMGMTAVANGTDISGLTTSTTPRLLSPMNVYINGDKETQLLLRMRVSKGTRAQLFFMREQDTVFTASQWLTIPIANNTDYVLYNITMNQIPSYSGLIKRLRLDPTNAKNAQVDIDYIRAIGPAPEGTPEWRFETETDTEGWSPLGTMPALSVASGVLSATSAGSTSSMRTANTLNVDASTKKIVGIRMRVGGLGTTAVFNWRRSGDVGFDITRRKVFNIINNGNFNTYYLDLSSDPNYTGTVTQIRMVPTDAVGLFEIDWIGFID
ncbi:MAG TPA: hypothetical protein PKH07_15300, partial [bacterium]|nr:hypothetical protein [bacterium]